MSDLPCTRRAFLRQSGCLAISMAALGLASQARDLPVADIHGTSQGGDVRYPVPPSDSVNVDRQQQIILVRRHGEVFALALACPHQNAAVRWRNAQGRFECTKHHSKYDADGHYLSGRATRNLDRFPIRRDGPTVVVDATRVWHADDNPAEWAAAVAPTS